jgi:hypothetical protein
MKGRPQLSGYEALAAPVRVQFALVVAVFRLPIAEAVQAPEVARTLDSLGRGASRAALRHIMSEARAAGLIAGRPTDLAEQFAALLWRDLMIIYCSVC